MKRISGQKQRFDHAGDIICDSWELSSAEIISIFGANEEHLPLYINMLPVQMGVRGNTVTVQGQALLVEVVRKAINAVIVLAQGARVLSAEEITYTVGSTIEAYVPEVEGNVCAFLGEKTQFVTKKGKPITVKTFGQQRYMDAINSHRIIFGLGPAGTGKTYLAVAAAVHALEHKQVRRIILTRPVVEAGENLGFLPGSLSEKIDPFLRPLFDALGEMLGSDTVERLIAHKVIEIAPLAYMRGRTLNEAFIILDEAQNTTPEQMKMFLTRLGESSIMVITGDITQIDRKGNQSGIIHARKIVEKIPDIAFVDLSGDDVVRSTLVSHIVRAYDHDH